ncbi:MAG: glycosyltransferase family 4 protein [Bacteroidota bacterium]
MAKVVYCTPVDASFVRKDIAMLAEAHTVRTFRFIPKKNWHLPWHFFRQFLWLLWHLPRTKTVFVMFGSYHSLLPALLGRLFGKKVLIILGGTDCVNFPSINYGSFRKPVMRWFLKWSYKMASELLPVHESLITSDYNYWEGGAPAQGCKVHLPKLKTPYTPIYNGYDPARWNGDFSQKTPNTFLGVALVNSEMRYVLKGYDLVVEVARDFPECQFTFVGFADSFKVPDLPDNVTLIPFVTQEKLRELLRHTEFYLQLSISEGFPNGLAEAMLCQCIPIGSNVAAIPSMIADTGLLLLRRDTDMLRDLLRKAISLPDKATRGPAARARIIREYHTDRRKAGLLSKV